MKKKIRAVQYFSDEALERGRRAKPADIIQFLEDFRNLHAETSMHDGSGPKSQLISIRIPANLLRAFRKKAELQGVAYQTQIKKLMKEWLLS